MQSLAALTMPGGPELIVILVIFVLLFGAKKLPELGSSVGKSIKNFKRGIDEGGSADDEVPTAGSTESSRTTTSAGREE